MKIYRQHLRDLQGSLRLAGGGQNGKIIQHMDARNVVLGSGHPADDADDATSGGHSAYFRNRPVQARRGCARSASGSVERPDDTHAR